MKNINNDNPNKMNSLPQQIDENSFDLLNKDTHTRCILRKPVSQTWSKGMMLACRNLWFPARYH